MEQWKEYCKLVRSTPLSAEQIVSIIKPQKYIHSLPDELIQIRLVKEATVRKFRTVQFEGDRQVEQDKYAKRLSE